MLKWWWEKVKIKPTLQHVFHAWHFSIILFHVAHSLTNKLSLQSSNERSGSSEHLSNAETWSSHERILCKSNLPTSTLELEQNMILHLMQQFLCRNPDFFPSQATFKLPLVNFFLATHTFDPFKIFYSYFSKEWLKKSASIRLKIKPL